MRLQDIDDSYHAGKLDKAEFVAEMQLVHRQLLDYADYLPRTDISSIEITDGRVVLTVRSTGVKFRYDDPLDQYCALTLLNFGNYEVQESNMLFHMVRATAGDAPFTFLDVGANFGWYALTMAKLFPAAKVHAFEPLPETYLHLKQNLDMNGFANVWLHPLGFMEKEGTQVFYFDAHISGRASARNLVEDPAVSRVSCPVTRLDEFTRTHALRPDFLKVDVEGAELTVFQGGLETLRNHRPVILTEMLRKWSRKFGYHPNELMALLGGLGYQCFFLENGRLVELQVMTEAVTAINFFFLHRDKHAGLLAALQS